MTLSGVGFGLMTAAGLMPFIKNLLFGVSPLDPLTLTAAPVLFISAASIACYIPARRAARVDPLTALCCH